MRTEVSKQLCLMMGLVNSAYYDSIRKLKWMK
jgi:hypothetical protein